MSKPDTGIYRKYVVTRWDGKDFPGGKHCGCFLFVLDLDHDPHARQAALAYADAAEGDFPRLAEELRTYALGSSSERAALKQRVWSGVSDPTGDNDDNAS